MSALGSVANIFQTGWLYNYLIRKDVSIPIISSMAGVTYGRRSPPLSPLAIALFCCVVKGKIPFIIGGLLLIVGYGFAAPTAPSIFSVESIVLRDA